MAKDFFLFPSSEKLENSIAVRFFEHLSGKKLTGSKLKFGYFFGTGIIVAFSLSLIDAAFSLLNSSALGMIAARAAVNRTGKFGGGFV